MKVPSCRQRSGQSLVEFMIGLMVACIVVIVLIDLSILIWGVQNNDRICRDAARAAASGDPSGATERARAVIARSNLRPGGGPVSPPMLLSPVGVDVTSQPIVQIDETTGDEVSPGGPVTGTVTVTTEIEVSPMVIAALLSKDNKLTFRSTQTYPITHVAPPVEAVEDNDRHTSGETGD